MVDAPHTAPTSESSPSPPPSAPNGVPTPSSASATPFVLQDDGQLVAELPLDTYDPVDAAVRMLCTHGVVDLDGAIWPTTTARPTSAHGTRTIFLPGEDACACQASAALSSG